MLNKALTQLAISLVLGTLIALLLPWRSRATLSPGESKTFSLNGDFVAPVPDQENRYYKLEEAAGSMTETGKLEGGGGLRVDAVKAVVTARQVQWTEGSRNNKNTITAPGGNLSIAGAVQAPSPIPASQVVPLEWHSTYFQDHPQYRGRLTFKNSDMRVKDGSVLVNQWILAGPGYWPLILPKAFYIGVPFGLVIFTIAATVNFGRPSKFSPPAGFPVSFEGNYNTLRTYFCMFGLIACMPGIIIACIHGFSNAGDHLDDHWGLALGMGLGYLAVVLVILLIRRLGIRSVELTEDAVEVRLGDGWGPHVRIPWCEVRAFLPGQQTKGGQILVSYVDVKYDAAGRPKKLRITSNSTREYDTFLKMSEALVARHARSA